MKYKVFNYSFKVWVTSAFITPIVLTPILLTVGRVMIKSDNVPKSSFSSMIGGYLEISLSLLVASLIPWIFILLILPGLANSRLTLLQRNLVISSIAVAVPGAFLCIGASSSNFSNWQTGFLGWIGFAISTALCVWFYKLQPADDTIVRKRPLP